MMLKKSFEATVSMDTEMFPALTKLLGVGTDLQNSQTIEGQHTYVLTLAQLSFFTSQEVQEMRKRITEFEHASANRTNLRNNGSKLKGHIEKIESYKEGLLIHIQAIKDILTPKEVVRMTLKDAEAQALQASVLRVAESFKNVPEKLLRGFAASLLGVEEQEYTYEELPLAIATKQITGQMLEKGV